MVGGVSLGKFAAIQHQHPSDVGRDIAIANHCRPPNAQVELARPVVRMRVVPGDKLSRRVRTR
jgi:hypothetical protein